MNTIASAQEPAAPGTPVGTTAWVRLSQDMLTQFEVVTRSNDPLHMDADWVRRNTEFANTIAPGMLTLSLLPYFASQLNLASEDHYSLNYGFDRVRWIQPVPVDADVRAHFVALGTTELPGGRPGHVARFDVKVEIRGFDRPALVAEWLGAIVPRPALK